MSALTHRSVFMLGFFLLAAVPCFAQTKPAPEVPAAATFDQLADVTRLGTKVVVRDVNGKELTGRFDSITAGSLVLKVGALGGKTLEMKRDQIQIVRKPGDSSVGGAVAGALAGLGVAIGAALFGSEDGNFTWTLALIPIGGVAGYFADRASNDRQLLYARPAAPRVSFGHELAAGVSVRADLGLASAPNRRPAPRAAANIVVSLGSSHRKDR